MKEFHIITINKFNEYLVTEAIDCSLYEAALLWRNKDCHIVHAFPITEAQYEEWHKND